MAAVLFILWRESRPFHRLDKLILQLACFTIITLVSLNVRPYDFTARTDSQLNGFEVFLEGNWDTSTFIAAYISTSRAISYTSLTNRIALPLFGGCWVGWKYIKKTKFVSLLEMDFETGRRELDEMEARDAVMYRPETKWQKVVSILF